MPPPTSAALQREELCISLRILLIWVASALGLALLSPSCGRDTVKLDLDDRERMYRSLYSASPQNVSQWVDLWDGESWIVGLNRNQVAEPQEPEFRSLVINSLSNHFSNSLLPNELAPFRDLLNQGVSFQFSHSPNPTQFQGGVEPGDSTEWFGKVSFATNSPLWKKIIGRGIPILPLPKDLVAQLAETQFLALKAVPTLEWVEPNLGHDPQNCDLEDPDVGTTAGSTRPSEWYKEGGQLIPPCENRIRQVYSRVNFHKAQDYFKLLKESNPGLEKQQIVIAVVDTGIDYEHEDLKGKMFANPGEVGGAEGVDDDGNGYIDDIYGIDTTIPKGKIDGSYNAPGAADVGGPGKECPPEANSGGNTGSCGHGTHVAGIIAAETGGLQAVGLCDKCQLYSIRASKKCVYPETALLGKCVPPTAEKPADGSYIANGKIFDWDQILGLNYLLNFPPGGEGDGLYTFIVNMSLGKYVYNRAMATALSKLQDSQVLVIAAAGNDNTETPMFPAAYKSTLAVCATSEDEGTRYTLDAFSRESKGKRGKYAKTDFSNFGDWVDLCAPGMDIQSSYPGNQINVTSGTSQASPLVAGAAGYIWSIFHEESLETIRTLLERYANPNVLYDIESNPMNAFYGGEIAGIQNYLLGSGMLDMEASIKAKAGAEVTPSFVDVDQTVGADSQLSSGCVVSTIGRSKAWSRHAWTSLPLLLFQALAVLLLWRRFIHRGQRFRQSQSRIRRP